MTNFDDKDHFDVPHYFPRSISMIKIFVGVITNYFDDQVILHTHTLLWLATSGSSSSSSSSSSSRGSNLIGLVIDPILVFVSATIFEESIKLQQQTTTNDKQSNC